MAIFIRRNWAFIAVAFLVFLANIAGGYFLLEDLYFAERRIYNQASGYTVVIRAFSDSQPAVVFGDSSKKEGSSRFLGVGFVLKDGEKFYVATNDHVANSPPSSELYVQFKDERGYHKMRRLGWDKVFDLALLEFEENDFRPAVYAALGDSEKLEARDRVFIYGHPLGFKFSWSEGRIMKPKEYGFVGKAGFLEIDATCNPGNSGGPVIAKNGKVIGVAAAMTRDGHPICMAVPARSLKILWSKLKAGGEIKHGIIGIGVWDSWNFLPEEKKKLGLENLKAGGVVVIAVVPGSPADEAGIKEGDIILSFGKTADDPGIKAEFAGEFMEDLNLYFLAGDEVVFKIRRGDDYLVRKVRMADPEILEVLPREEAPPPGSNSPPGNTPLPGNNPPPGGAPAPPGAPSVPPGP